MSSSTVPLELTANQPPNRFYAGGDFIAEFRGEQFSRPHTPEDWIGSVTEVRGESPAGLTYLANDVSLRDAVAEDPEGWLGTEHAQTWGADTQLLVKLLDAGERLPVHAHPDASFARTRLNCSHGKAEAWYILRGGDVMLGLRKGIARQELNELIRAQNREALLDLLNVIPVHPGDTVLVPPRTLHAIGQGVAVVEVQQPEDQSVLLEWQAYGIKNAQEASLGLGFESALDTVSLEPLDAAGRRSLIRQNVGVGPALVETANQWFRLDRVVAEMDFEPGFSILVGENTGLELRYAGGALRVRRGTTVLIPAAAGRFTLTGSGSAILARPPLPS